MGAHLRPNGSVASTYVAPLDCMPKSTPSLGWIGDITICLAYVHLGHHCTLAKDASHYLIQ